ncbi:hypothetical protein [Salmonella sp. 32011801201800027SM]|uniref:hypothetical protein n=1 Tax=Salmonella sp. 32011801201800027SM TaxID=2819754 RepID=UPI001AB015AF|nr:hypothetical protein [Salmonella sp. 32011801201800027SM]
MISKANQQKISFAWGVGISGMRTDSRFSEVSAEFLIKKPRRRAKFYATAAVQHRDYLSVDMP